jgi:hypothetical protein
MLFVIHYDSKHESEELEKRGLDVFKAWTPPAGVEFKAHYAYADGLGGTAVVEADSAALLYEAVIGFHAFNDFEVHPVIEIADAIPISDKVTAWRESVR